MKRIFGLVGLIGWPYWLMAQVAAIHMSVFAPEPDSLAKGVFLAGNFNYWHSGDSLYRMHPEGNGWYSLTIPVFDNRAYEYKYTLGNWERVEVLANDSTRQNRKFLASPEKMVRDTVLKWKQPAPVNQQDVARLQKVNAMKDSVLERIKPGLNEMLELLKKYTANWLREKPSRHVQKVLDKKAGKKLTAAYTQITRLFWDAMALLTPEEKKMMQEKLKPPYSKGDYLNTFFDAFNQVMEKK